MGKQAAAFAAAFTAISLLTACGSGRAVQASDTERTEATTVVEASEEKRPEAEEKTLAKYLTGIRDRNILEGAMDIDFLSEAGSIEQVITKVEVDDKDVDTSKTGVYTVRYRVTVDLENLEKAETYIKEHPEAAVKPDPSDAKGDKNSPAHPEPAAAGDGENPGPQNEKEEAGDTIQAAETGSGEQEEKLTEAEEDNTEPGVVPGETGAASGQEGTDEGVEADLKEKTLPDIPDSVFEEEKDDGSPRDTAEIIIKKEVRIVTPEEAEEIIKEGGEVWTDKSRPVEPDDLKKDESAGSGKTNTAEQAEPAKEEENSTERKYDEENSPETDGGDDAGEKSSDDETVSTHTHDWVEQTETIHHEEEGHYETVQTGTETVIDEEAWDEPVYDYVQVCSVCGYSTDSDDDIIAHMVGHTDENGDLYGSYSSKRVQVDTIHHPALSHEEPVYEQEWRVDKKAWDEEVVTGYRCRTCGAEK